MSISSSAEDSLSLLSCFACEGRRTRGAEEGALPIYSRCGLSWRAHIQRQTDIH